MAPALGRPCAGVVLWSGPKKTDYERKRWPIEPPDTIDAIRYRMAAFGANIPKSRATIDLLEAADFASYAAEAKWRPRASDSRRDWKMEVR
jgi:hypothetical protein